MSQETHPAAAELVGEVAGLVSPPIICLKLMELIQQDESSAQDLGDVIANDPNLTSRLLRLVNSAYFNFPRKIETVSRAISIVGTRELYSLVVAISAVNTFSRIATSLVNMDTFWRHSIFTGLMARELAREHRVLHPERLFVAGLLHDIGMLVLFNRSPDTAAELLLIAAGDEEVFYQAEIEKLGFTHADIGGLLMQQWQLPETLQDAVLYHHVPYMAEQGKVDAALVHMANILANRSDLGSFAEDHTIETEFDQSVWKTLGTEQGSLDIDLLIGNAGLQFAETIGVMFS